MQIFNIFNLIIICSMLCGCNGIRSSYHFTKGTECYEKGDYQNARLHLEEACELDPSMARNHNNLACTYIHLGEIDKAWYRTRQAAFVDPSNEEALINFNSLMSKLEASHNITKGSSKEDVKAALGEPDMDSEENNYSIFRYGMSLLIFEGGKLSERSTISGVGVNDIWVIHPRKPL